MMKTWDETQTLDDIMSQEEKELMNKILGDKPKLCPYVKFFGWAPVCTIGLDENAKFEPNPLNPVYCNFQHMNAFQLYCKGEYEKCIDYKPLEKK